MIEKSREMEKDEAYSITGGATPSSRKISGTRAYRLQRGSNPSLISPAGHSAPVFGLQSQVFCLAPPTSGLGLRKLIATFK
jgi:hypothetical protein